MDNPAAEAHSCPAIVLVRHAQPVFPAPGGPDDYHRPLDSTGHKQARGLVEKLRWSRPALIASSPYLRARQTVEPLAQALELPVHTMPGLREWDSGLAPTPDWERHYRRSWEHPDWERTGGESLNQLTHRAATAIRGLANRHPGATIVIGSHGTFICRGLIGLGITGIDWPFSRAMPMPALYRLDLRDGQIRATGPGL